MGPDEKGQHEAGEPGESVAWRLPEKIGAQEQVNELITTVMARGRAAATLGLRGRGC